MQNFQELQEKIFFEAQSILESLSKISSKEELLTKQDLFSEVTDRIAFLRLLEKNKDSFVTVSALEDIDNQQSNYNSELETSSSELTAFDEDILEEEVLFTNDLNDIQQEEEVSESLEEESFEENISDEEVTPFVEEARGQIVEIESNHEPVDVVQEPFAESKVEPISGEKKFKLAHIKGLKAVEKIIADDPLEEFSSHHDEGSLIKSNVSTEYMEAPKPKPEFRLDLNDKVAFTKLLFKGNEQELKNAVDKLNSFTDLEEAKVYLSEIYYERDWKKVDEYAQRLWTLVENKFQ